jgi:hypothetical protein
MLHFGRRERREEVDGGEEGDDQAGVLQVRQKLLAVGAKFVDKLRVFG